MYAINETEIEVIGMALLDRAHEMRCLGNSALLDGWQNTMLRREYRDHAHYCEKLARQLQKVETGTMLLIEPRPRLPV